MISDFKLRLSRTRPVARRRTQHGVILAVTLIVLVILLVSSVALIRSFNASTAVSGALALRRDLVNQAERAVTQVVTQNFAATAPNLITQAQRWTNNKNFNYSACQLAVDVHGVPVLLSDNANFSAGNDLTDLALEPWTDSNCKSVDAVQVSNDIPDPNTGITVRYVVDRLCANTGEYASSNCSVTPVAPVNYQDVRQPRVNSPAIPIYRISIRAQDPRGATTYLQTTFSN